MDYSISLNGISAAFRNMDNSARRLAHPGPATDVAAELVAADQARISGQANLRVIAAERDLEDAILDIFA